MAELDPRRYSVAWLAPLPIEAKAAMHMLDKRHDGHFPLTRGDDYVYQAGEVCGHNVIIATLPAGQEYGTGSAAALASQVKKFFPNLWFGLLVGVAAGLPKLTGPSPRAARRPGVDHTESAHSGCGCGINGRGDGFGDWPGYRDTGYGSSQPPD